MREWISLLKVVHITFLVASLDQLAAITATGGVSIEASGSLFNQGGDINANDGDLEIKALRVETIGLGSGKVYVRKTCVLTCSYEGDVELEAALVPTLVTRPKGLYNFWGSKAAWVFLRDQFGSIVADTGNITVISDRPVKITGGTIATGGNVELENGQEIVRIPGAQSDVPNHTIGFFADFPIVRQ